MQRLTRFAANPLMNNITTVYLDSIENNAREFAIKAHGNQQYGNCPYIYHLDQVAKSVAEFSPRTIVIAYLHDILEDTDMTFDYLQDSFGFHIARSVFAISAPKTGSRKEKLRRMYFRASILKNSGLPFTDAFAVKTADRYENVRECVHQPKPSLLKRYKLEHKDFRDVFYVAGLCDEKWSMLDSVCS